MAEFADRQISQLSGGQQQRVFLARALAQDAELYLMDEPFQGVDATTERAIVELLRELRARGKTVVAVHHDLQTVPEYFDQRRAAQHPADRERPGRRGVHRGEPAARRTAAARPSSGRTAR